jgi:hypothetical protein
MNAMIFIGFLLSRAALENEATSAATTPLLFYNVNDLVAFEDYRAADEHAVLQHCANADTSQAVGRRAVHRRLFDVRFYIRKQGLESTYARRRLVVLPIWVYYSSQIRACWARSSRGSMPNVTARGACRRRARRRTCPPR